MRRSSRGSHGSAASVEVPERRVSPWDEVRQRVQAGGIAALASPPSVCTIPQEGSPRGAGALARKRLQRNMEGDPTDPATIMAQDQQLLSLQGEVPPHLTSPSSFRQMPRRVRSPEQDGPAHILGPNSSSPMGQRVSMLRGDVLAMQDDRDMDLMGEDIVTPCCGLPIDEEQIKELQDTWEDARFQVEELVESIGKTFRRAAGRDIVEIDTTLDLLDEQFTAMRDVRIQVLKMKKMLDGVQRRWFRARTLFRSILQGTLEFCTLVLLMSGFAEGDEAPDPDRQKLAFTCFFVSKVLSHANNAASVQNMKERKVRNEFEALERQTKYYNKAQSMIQMLQSYSRACKLLEEDMEADTGKQEEFARCIKACESVPKEFRSRLPKEAVIKYLHDRVQLKREESFDPEGDDPVSPAEPVPAPLVALVTESEQERPMPKKRLSRSRRTSEPVRVLRPKLPRSCSKDISAESAQEVGMTTLEVDSSVSSQGPRPRHTSRYKSRRLSGKRRVSTVAEVPFLFALSRTERSTLTPPQDSSSSSDDVIGSIDDLFLVQDILSLSRRRGSKKRATSVSLNPHRLGGPSSPQRVSLWTPLQLPPGSVTFTTSAPGTPQEERVVAAVHRGSQLGGRRSSVGIVLTTPIKEERVCSKELAKHSVKAASPRQESPTAGEMGDDEGE